MAGLDSLEKRRKTARIVLKRLSKHLKTRPFLGRKLGEYTPFQVLVSTIISQRTRDEKTDIASARLFARFKTPKAVAGAGAKEIARLIRACGFYNQKAKRIKQVAGMLVREYNCVVPNSKAELMSFPGVGAKTAGCVLVYGFGIPAIPVDTHVHRVSNRLGLARTGSPEATEEALEKIFDKKDWVLVNEFFVKFGQTTCKPVHPLCLHCPLNDFCPTGRARLGKTRL